MTATATAKKFKKATITVFNIKTQAKDLSVEAELLGDYAIHPSINNFNSISLTHVPSGCVVWDFHIVNTGINEPLTIPKLKKQVKAAARLCAELPSYSWEELTAHRQTKARKALAGIVTKARSEKLF